MKYILCFAFGMLLFGGFAYAKDLKWYEAIHTISIAPNGGEIRVYKVEDEKEPTVRCYISVATNNSQQSISCVSVNKK